MVYAVLRFSNFGHGETMAFGAMVTILVTWGSVGRHLNPTASDRPLAIPVGILVTVLLTLLIDRFVYRYHRERKGQPSNFLDCLNWSDVLFRWLIRFVIGRRPNFL